MPGVEGLCKVLLGSFPPVMVLYLVSVLSHDATSPWASKPKPQLRSLRSTLLSFCQRSGEWSWESRKFVLRILILLQGVLTMASHPPRPKALPPDPAELELLHVAVGSVRLFKASNVEGS